LGGFTRREFLEAGLRGGVGLRAATVLDTGLSGPPAFGLPGRPLLPDPASGWRGDSSLVADLRSGRLRLRATTPALSPPSQTGSRPLAARFPDLRRHFAFEYYPWYANDPYRHWEQWDRRPPRDVAASSMPRLRAYDSRSRAVLETHARWIAESGAGSVSLSWWGQGSFEDRVAHQVMDVMHDHDIKVTFHLEPYSDHRGRYLAADALYLTREYGERRGWDALLLLRNEDGTEGPVFKCFRTILPPSYVDCHGLVRSVPDHFPDLLWRHQTDLLRLTLASDFDHVCLLADSLDFERTTAAGFDGVAIYDNFIAPGSYAAHAAGASAAGLLFSFNANPGFDGIEPRVIDPGSCYAPSPFAPPGNEIDFGTEQGRERAADRARQRVRSSLAASVAAQSDPRLSNAQWGFFLVYVNSFNEWHEGSAFEPMADFASLRPYERELGYHNPGDGGYRLATLRPLIQALLASSTAPQPVAGRDKQNRG